MDPVLLVVSGFGAVVLLVLMSVTATMYRKCGPSEALIISGGFEVEGSAPARNGPKVIVGGGTVVVPLFQMVSTISLELMSIDLKNTTPFPTRDSRGLYVNAVIEACIDKDPATILKAVGTFGSKTDKETRSIIYDIVYDHLRRILATMDGDGIQQKIDILTNAMLKDGAQDLASLGVQLRGFRVRDIREVRTNLTDSTASSSYATLPAITANASQGNGNKNVIGTIAVVSNTITSDQPGEVTYSLLNGSRSVRIAKTRMPGIVIDINTPVVITEQDSDSVFVESWSPIHACMPASQH